MLYSKTISHWEADPGTSGPQWGRVNEEDLRKLTEDLVPIRDDLRAQAKVRGWEAK